jgi:hypothetical protein
MRALEVGAITGKELGMVSRQHNRMVQKHGALVLHYFTPDSEGQGSHYGRGVGYYLSTEQYV